MGEKPSREAVSTHTATSGVRSTEGIGSEPVAAPPPDLPPLEGTHGDYVVGAEIARGGMGRIVEAYDRRHDRRVALKLLLRDDPLAEKRFAREAWITGRLQHPAIIPLYESGRWETGEPFFAMKLVRGGSLAEVLATKTTHEERLGLVPHLIALTEALAFAHAEGVVHRDLKPSNVLVGAFGETVVIDWGLAKRFADADADDEEGAPGASLDAAPSASLTAEGRVVGTPTYMSPEQARGERVDARADVYSLGACLYHALSGVPPYGRSLGGREAIAKLLAAPPVSLVTVAPQVPPDLATIVAKAMAREPADRYPSAKEMAEDLRRFATGRLVSSHAYTARELVMRWVRKRRALVAVVVVSVVTVVALAGFGVRRITRERDAARAARADAEAQRGTAVLRRDAAEKLIDSLVGDFRTRLIPIGKLDVMSALGEGVLDYYRSVPAADDADSATLVRRAKAIATLAGVAELQLHHDAAIPDYQDAIALCERAIAKNPDATDGRRDRAWYLYRVGLCEKDRFHFDEVLTYFDRSLTAFAEVEPTISDRSALADAKRRHALVVISKGEYLGKRGDLEQAESLLSGEIEREAHEDSIEAANSTPGWALEYRSDVRATLGDLQGALADARACLRLRTASAVTRPKDANASIFALDAREQTAELEAQRGDEVIPELRRIVDGYAGLLREDPTQANWSITRAESLGLLCDAERRLGEFDLGKNDCDMAAASDSEIVQTAPGRRSASRLGAMRNAVAAMDLARGDARAAQNRFARNSELLEGAAGLAHEALHDDALVDARIGIARSELALGDVDAVLRDAASLRDMIRAYLEHSPHNVLRLDRATVTELLLGDAMLARSDAAGAREAYEAARRGCVPLIERAPDNANVKLHCAEAYAKLAVQTENPNEAKQLRALAAGLVSRMDRRLVKPAAKDLPAVAP